MAELVVSLEAVGLEAIAAVGGKNASLGEMIRELSTEGVRVPGGFATTAAAYRLFISSGAARSRPRPSACCQPGCPGRNVSHRPRSSIFTIAATKP